MGNRQVQRIYECNRCGIIPEDGENMWWMGSEIWCEKCCKGEEEYQSIFKDEEKQNA